MTNLNNSIFFGTFRRFTVVIFFFLINNVKSQVDAPENNPRIVNVGVYISPPFVIQNDNKLSGMAIDLWEHIAKQLNITSKYVIYEDFHDLVVATNDKTVTVAVSNLTITKARAHLVDFTQPWYDAGLKIMINGNKSNNSSNIINGLRDAGHLNSYLFLFGVIILLTILITIFDRKFDQEFSKNWFEGLSESFYQVMLMFTSGSLNRKNLFGWIGRIFSGIWLAVGILVVAYVTSSITSVMTTLSISNQINELSDLKDKKVAVLKGSETETYVRNLGFSYQSFTDLNKMILSIENNKVDAIIGDAPVLEYYEFTNQNKSVKVVGNLFKPEKYGFGLSLDSDLKKNITLEILKAHESGLISKLKLDYFGENY